jgi:hypothetical protein
VKHERVSWRTLRAGMRIYDPSRGNPRVRFVIPTTRKTRRTTGIPGWYATDGPWRLVPRTGAVKIVVE